jgi:hypothetical protein
LVQTEGMACCGISDQWSEPFTTCIATESARINGPNRADLVAGPA